MKKVKLVALLVLVIALTILVLQNQTPWQVRFLWLAGEVPGIILLFVTTSAGFVAGLITAFLARRGAKPQK